jgi:hypothetical protein
MSNVEIRCPRCGSPSTLKNGTANEYECSHCNSTFRFIDPTRKTVVHEVTGRNCIKCGAPIRRDDGFICMDCKETPLCFAHVANIAGKYYCLDCYYKKTRIIGPKLICPICNGPLNFIQQYNRWFCNSCKIYPTNFCPTCNSPIEYYSNANKFYCKKCGQWVEDTKRNKQWQNTQSDNSLPWM